MASAAPGRPPPRPQKPVSRPQQEQRQPADEDEGEDIELLEFVDSDDGSTTVTYSAASAAAAQKPGWDAHRARASTLLQRWGEVMQEWVAAWQGPGDMPPSGTEEDFKLSRLRDNGQRFFACMEPAMKLHQSFVDLQCWRDPTKTGAAILYYYFFWWNHRMFVGLLFSLLLLMVRAKLRSHGYLVNALAKPAKDDDKEKDGLADRLRKAKQVARNIQNHLGGFADTVEKINNLLMWREPEKTIVVVECLGAVLLYFLIMPFDLGCHILQGLFGIKFFVIDAALSRSYRLREKYDTSLHFFRSLPTDADLEARRDASDRAMRVQRAQDQAEARRAAESSGDSGKDKDQDSGKSKGKEGLFHRLKAGIHAAGSSAKGGGEQDSDDNERAPPTSASDKDKPPSPARSSSSNKEIAMLRERFADVGRDEPLADSWKCVHTNSNMPMRPGKVYLTSQHLCFVPFTANSSDNNGCVCMNLENVVKVAKKNPLGLFLGSGFSIEVELTDQQPHTFSAMMSRDKALQAIDAAVKAVQAKQA
eukprot:m.66495 g.66495  ORF g.66495 m.66495 type:complete len:533 (+) comp16567_c0_seq1:123-1721(+)